MVVLLSKTEALPGEDDAVTSFPTGKIASADGLTPHPTHGNYCDS